jgi:predicted TIM-barrel fold metal-dependent hydrolase
MADQPALMLISSDGHVVAPMREYRPYIEQRYLDDFDAFVADAGEHRRPFDLPALAARLDPEYVEEWDEKMVRTGRVDNVVDPHLRLKEMEREGITAEVLFSDFGLPFELNSSVVPDGGSAALDYARRGQYEEYKAAGTRAFNRWLADFVSVAPQRWAGSAAIAWQQPADQVIAEMRVAKESGLRGITLPVFEREMPLYHRDFDPVWSALEDLGLVVHSHVGITSTQGWAVDRPVRTPAGVDHPAIAFRLMVQEMTFHVQNVLPHLIWGGVLERHPRLTVVFTEQNSWWPTPMLEAMDYTYAKSYFRTDYKDLLPLKPSEYFARQCYIGSSAFSRAEIAARHTIGLDKMMIGCDMPHHEGTLIETTRNYLQATLGAEKVPIDEARRILGENAAKVYGLDVDALEPIAARLNLRPEEVLTPPEKDLYPRGDVGKPLSLA